ncbi:MAG: TolC family protein [Candidatus Omnitrophica bacterium]|nr:TolC family protein [Candidatus Omnitrophota bacterium]MCM8802442.1 TolC family protein [Candidatus Omnitrophota bacterium]
MRKFLIVLSIIFSISFAEEILNLDDCIKIAIENNLKIKIAKNKIEQAFYQKEIAIKYLLPSLSLSFNYTHLGDNEGIIFGGFGPLKFTEDNLYTFTFTLKQPLFTGKKIERMYQIAEESYEKSEIDYEKQVSDLILDVKKNYFNILKAKRFVETSKKYKENLEKHLINAKKMFEQGIVTKVDILKTEVALKNVETKIIESENYLKLAKANLNFILNRNLDYQFEVEDILELKEEKKDYKWWIETGLKERKEIKSFEKIISIYQKNIDIEKSNLYPQIYFFFNYNIERGTQSSLEKWDTNWNTGILLSYDIWNWGQTKDKIKKAEREKEEVENQYKLLKNSIEIEIKNAYLNFIAGENKIEESKKQIEVAEENLRVAEILYKEGLATTTDVIDAITSLTEAKNNYYNALYEYKTAYSELEKVSGVLKLEAK